jgi:hypothetical protein
VNLRMTGTVVAICVSMAGQPALSQRVAHNEALMGDATVPAAPGSLTPLCRTDAACHAGAWYMVETETGLLECTEPYARPGTCRSSTYGSQKLPRVWVVKHGGRWLWCQYPDLASRCAQLFARHPANLPFSAVQ